MSSITGSRRLMIDRDARERLEVAIEQALVYGLVYPSIGGSELSV